MTAAIPCARIRLGESGRTSEASGFVAVTDRRGSVTAAGFVNAGAYPSGADDGRTRDHLASSP